MARPEIMILEGNEFKTTSKRRVLGEILSGDDYNKYSDALMGQGQLRKVDVDYLTNQYPTLMGIWPALAKIGAKIGKLVGKGIKKAVERKKARQAAKKAQAAQAVAMRPAVAAPAANNKKILLIGGAVAVAAGIILLSSKKK